MIFSVEGSFGPAWRSLPWQRLSSGESRLRLPCVRPLPTHAGPLLLQPFPQKGLPSLPSSLPLSFFLSMKSFFSSGRISLHDFFSPRVFSNPIIYEADVPPYHFFLLSDFPPFALSCSFLERILHLSPAPLPNTAPVAHEYT